MANETCSVTYDDYHKNLTIGLKTLLESESFANVTIAVEGRLIRAHQMVLSMYSPYFKALFENNPCKHPIFFLKDVRYQIMKDLLTFMYEGKVQIEPHDLAPFVETAKALEIKGLAEVQSDNGLGRPLPKETLKPPEPRKPSLERHSRVQEHQRTETWYSEQRASSSSSSPSPNLSNRVAEIKSSPAPSTSGIKLNESTTDLTNDVEIIPAAKKQKLTEKIPVPADCELINLPPSTSREDPIISEEKVEATETTIMVPTSENNTSDRFLTDPIDETIDLDDDDPEFEDGIKMEIEDSNDPHDEEDDLLEPMPDTSAQEIAGYEGEPVLVHETYKDDHLISIIYKDYRFRKHAMTNRGASWRCSGNYEYCCRARLYIKDKQIIEKNLKHTHDSPVKITGKFIPTTYYIIPEPPRKTKASRVNK